MSGGRFNSGDIELLRDDLAGLLLGSSKPAEYIFNDTITSLKQDDTQVFVTFQHHPPRHFDLVIGADGLPATGRRVSMPGINIFRLRDGLVKDYQIFMDITPVFA